MQVAPQGGPDLEGPGVLGPPARPRRPGTPPARPPASSGRTGTPPARASSTTASVVWPMPGRSRRRPAVARSRSPSGAQLGQGRRGRPEGPHPVGGRARPLEQVGDALEGGDRVHGLRGYRRPGGHAARQPVRRSSRSGPAVAPTERSAASAGEPGVRRGGRAPSGVDVRLRRPAPRRCAPWAEGRSRAGSPAADLAGTIRPRGRAESAPGIVVVVVVERRRPPLPAVPGGQRRAPPTTATSDTVTQVRTGNRWPAGGASPPCLLRLPTLPSDSTRVSSRVRTAHDEASGPASGIGGEGGFRWPRGWSFLTLRSGCPVHGAVVVWFRRWTGSVVVRRAEVRGHGVRQLAAVLLVAWPCWSPTAAGGQEADEATSAAEVTSTTVPTDSPARRSPPTPSAGPWPSPSPAAATPCEGRGVGRRRCAPSPTGGGGLDQFTASAPGRRRGRRLPPATDAATGRR